MIDTRISNCVTEIDALPVKPPYDDFKTMVDFILRKYFPEARNVRMNTLRAGGTKWKSRGDGHLGGTESL